MVILFWGLRLILVFTTIALAMFSWRASFTVAVCLFFDLFGMIVAGMPGAGLWNHSRMMLGVGLSLGGIVSIGRLRGNYWDIPLLALTVSVPLTASWLQDRDSFGYVIKVLPAYLASVVALPAGCLCTTMAVNVAKRGIKRYRAQSSRES